jgi:hypothetical protein
MAGQVCLLISGQSIWLMNERVHGYSHCHCLGFWQGRHPSPFRFHCRQPSSDRLGAIVTLAGSALAAPALTGSANPGRADASRG